MRYVLDVLGDLIPYAVGVALSPLPMIALLLVLQSPSARAASGLFLIGRYAAVAVIAVIAAFGAELLPESTETSTVGAWLRIALGVALVGWGVTKTLRWLRGRDQRPELPGWLAAISTTTPARATRLAVILSAVNVKELAFGLGAGLTIAAGDLAAGATTVTSLVYAMLACSGLIAVVAAFWMGGSRVGGPLGVARDWLVRNHKVVVAGVLLVVGSILVGEGLRAL